MQSIFESAAADELERHIEAVGAPLFVVDVKPDGRFIYLCANRALEAALGVSREQICGLEPHEFLAPGEAERIVQLYGQCVAARAPIGFEEEFEVFERRKWWRTTLSPVLGEAGRVVRIVGAAVDVTSEHDAQAEFEYEHELLQLQQQLTPDGIMIAAPSGEIMSCNERCKEIWGLTDAMVSQGREVTYPHMLAQLKEPAPFRHLVERAYADLRLPVDAVDLELVDGRVLVCFSRGVFFRQMERARIWFYRDVTENRQGQKALRDARQWKEAILSSAAQAIMAVDRDHILRELNPAAERLLGYASGDLIGRRTCLELFDPVELEQRRLAASARCGHDVDIDELLHGRAREGVAETQEWHLIHKEGHRIPVELTVSNLTNCDGESLGFIGVLEDISERKERERALRRMAMTDPLTGLWNRAQFEQAGRVEVERAVELGQPISVIVLDVDHFKKVNDTYGHAAGDAVLAAVASALPDCLRASDLFCRWGGEEFVVALPGTPLHRARRVAERIRAFIARMGTVHAGRRIDVTASLGAAVWQSEESDLAGAIDRADHALYAAKTAGRNCVRVWDAAPPATGTLPDQSSENARRTS